MSSDVSPAETAPSRRIIKVFATFPPRGRKKLGLIGSGLPGGGRVSSERDPFVKIAKSRSEEKLFRLQMIFPRELYDRSEEKKKKKEKKEKEKGKRNETRS